MKKICIMGIALIICFCTFNIEAVHAEGSKDLTQNGGYRPYIERNGKNDHGVARKQIFYARVKQGETVHLATSVTGADLTGMNIPEEYLNSEMRVRLFADETTAEASGYDTLGIQDEFYNVTTDGTGYIANRTEETNGINGVNNTDNSGYDAYEFVASRDGVIKIEFFSTLASESNPECDPVDSQWKSKGSTIAAWDITITDTANQIKSGRVYTKTLFLNMGNNLIKSGSHDMGGALFSKVYIYTDDAYIYEVDFNGMDPFGFIFYANSRGVLYKNPLIDESSGSPYSSMYHSAVANDNDMMSGLDNIYFNINPVESKDSTYKIFINNPDTEFYAPHSTLANNTIKNLKFIGNKIPKNADENTTLVQTGGRFEFQVDGHTASSYQIKLNFGTDNTVILSDNIKTGKNVIYWDGKDGNGNWVEPGTYETEFLEVKGGEIHFPFIDVENNPNGIKVTRLNGADSDTDKRIVYYNNVNDDTSRFGTKWTSVAGGGNHSVNGVDSQNGAMKFSSINQFNFAESGNQALIDMWTYIEASTTSKALFVVTDKTSFDPPKDDPKNPPNDNPATDDGSDQDHQDAAKTGDSMNLGLYLKVLVVAGIVVIGAIIRKRKS